MVAFVVKAVICTTQMNGKIGDDDDMAETPTESADTLTLITLLGMKIDFLRIFLVHVFYIVNVERCFSLKYTVTDRAHRYTNEILSARLFV